MTIANEFNTLNKGKWSKKVYEADVIWSETLAILDQNQTKLPLTPRRPDVRMIVNNTTGQEIIFQNPGNHSDAHPEHIPGTGAETAIMVMVQGDTLDEQYANAQKIYDILDLGNKGLTQDFVTALTDGRLTGLISEAYGKAPFEGQSAKLVDVSWGTADGKDTVITPVKGTHAAFGARAATNEPVFLAQFNLFVKGTGTTPELVESDGMNIAINEDWQTKVITTARSSPA